MSSSSSPIELTILSVKPRDSHVHHAASHVYAVVKKKKKKKFSFFILSFNLVKVQDCWIMLPHIWIRYAKFHVFPADDCIQQKKLSMEQSLIQTFPDK